MNNVGLARLLFTLAVALVGALGCMTAAVAGSEAEYAVRWDPAQGGPKTAEEVLSLLPKGKGKKGDDVAVDRFEVRYATVSDEGGTKVIVRERHRTSKQRYELTYKVRRDTPFGPDPDLGKGKCPVGGNAKDPKDQVDIGFMDSVSTKRVFSRTCSVESKDATPPVPAQFKAKLQPCTSQMTRLESGAYKVEQWSLAGGRVAIEVSMNGDDTPLVLETFQKAVVEPLMERGIKPLDVSKTELGSNCKG